MRSLCTQDQQKLWWVKLNFKILSSLQVQKDRQANKNSENNILQNQQILCFQAIFMNNTLVSLAICTIVTIFVYFLGLYMGKKKENQDR